jgi:hypothetical protein
MGATLEENDPYERSDDEQSDEPPLQPRRHG